ncbi:MAG: hypothetical protein IIA19_07075 [Thaumarchaeota archaeon]|nr:hypothetical protein [Nitrososphaerota archaeon]
MSSKIILPIVVAVSVIVTVGIMFVIGFDQQPEVSTIPTPPQIVYVDKTVSEFFKGTQEIRKISSESELTFRPAETEESSRVLSRLIAGIQKSLNSFN